MSATGSFNQPALSIAWQVELHHSEKEKEDRRVCDIRMPGIARIRFLRWLLVLGPEGHLSRALTQYDTVILIVPSLQLGTSFGSLVALSVSPHSPSHGFWQ